MEAIIGFPKSNICISENKKYTILWQVKTTT